MFLTTISKCESKFQVFMKHGDLVIATLIVSDLEPEGGFLRATTRACDFNFFSNNDSTSFSLDAISTVVWSSDVEATPSSDFIIVQILINRYQIQRFPVRCWSL